ncbi:MAG TPA: MFS transporter [Spirochaetota bacterium]|nr:MFS transporter [Spirochaetota bacterium]HOR43734.1 MFS transporter [Spirochaetota bacterium]HPK55257.1 MFS transporter [Spirochaetota bacterium]
MKHFGSFLFFLLFFMFGSTTPILGLYFTKHLGFGGLESGIILSLAAAGGIIAPTIGLSIADRLISSERLLAVMLFGASTVLFSLSFITEFKIFAPVYFLMALFTSNILPLGNAVIFHHLKDKNKYGRIRLWGTIGWICAAWFFGYVWMNPFFNPHPQLSQAFILGSCASLILGISVLFIKIKRTHKPQVKAKFKGFINKEALSVLRSSKGMRYAAVIFIAACSDKFYMYAAAPYLKASGIKENSVSPFLTLGQLSEIFAMIFLSVIVVKFGYRATIIAGSVFNMIRYAMFILPSGVFIFPGIFCHGLAYTLVFPVITIMVDQLCSEKDRAGVHQIYGMITGGAASIVGNIFCGRVLDYFTNNGITDFKKFWLIPLTMTMIQVISVFYLIEYKRKSKFFITQEISET